MFELKEENKKYLRCNTSRVFKDLKLYKFCFI